MDPKRNQKAQAHLSSSPESNERDPGFPYVTFFATFFLTFNTVVAVIRAYPDIMAVSFILSIYVSVILLFLCIHVYDRLPEGSEKERLKIPILTLMTVLHFLFAYRVSTILPLALDLLVWILAVSTSLLGFYLFFIYPISASHKNRSGANQFSPVEEVSHPHCRRLETSELLLLV